MNTHQTAGAPSVFTHPSVFWAALFLILVLGFILRLLSWSSWAFLGEGPLLTSRPLPGNADGYFYLGLARDLIEGIYHNSEWLRVFPESPLRPNPAPMLPLVTSLLTQLTGFQLELIAGVLPAALGTLVAIPAAIIGRQLGGRLVAIAAATFSVLMPYFAQRSALGWYDTDTLNVILPLCMAASATSYLDKTIDTRCALSALLVYIGSVTLLFLWWDQAPYVVALLSIFPLSLVLIFRWPDRRIRYGSAGLLMLIFAAAPISFYDTFARSLSVFRYVTAQDESAFSPTAIAIGEQQFLGILESTRMAAGNWFLLLCALVGILCLSRKRPRLFLPLTPFYIIGGFGLFHAERFLIFLNPVVAIGLAGLFALAREYLSRVTAFVVITAMSVSFAFILFVAHDYRVASPIVPLDIVKHMTQIPKELPSEAVLWNLCDYGYALSYWGRRATVCDGSSHTGALRTFTSFPLYADTPLQSARFVHFFLARGQAGMRKLMDRYDQDWSRSRAFLEAIYNMPPKLARNWLAEQWTDLTSLELDEWSTFLFPPETRPAYLILDRQTMRNTHWWFWFSSWDAERRAGIHPNYYLFPKMPLAEDDGRIIDPDGLFTIDTYEGFVKFRGQMVMLRRLRRTNGVLEEATDFQNEGHWIMDINIADGYGVLHDPFTHNKVGHQLYMQTMNDPLFEPVYLAGAEFQIWHVQHPDTIATDASGYK